MDQAMRVTTLDETSDYYSATYHYRRFPAMNVRPNRYAGSCARCHGQKVGWA